MEKVQTHNATYLLYTKAPSLDPEPPKCDASYGETAEVGKTFQDLLEIFSSKYGRISEANKIFVGQKYVLLAHRTKAGELKKVLIGVGVALWGYTLRDILKLWGEITENKRMGRRSFVTDPLKIVAELIVSSVYTVSVYKKFGSIKKFLEELEKEKETPVTPFFYEASSAITAIILEKGVVPKIGKEKPVICVAMDEDKTGVNVDTLKDYLERPEKRKGKVDGYKEYLRENFGQEGKNISENLTQKILFLNKTTGKLEEYEINVLE